MNEELDRLFAALADPTRRNVVELLWDGPRRAGDLACVAGVSPPVMSRHLRVLLLAGIVDDERSPTDARVRLFFLRKEPIGRLQAWLGGRRTGGDDDGTQPDEQGDCHD
jgi:DNA-binding transcriptional ArsR family regulator